MSVSMMDVVSSAGLTWCSGVVSDQCSVCARPCLKKEGKRTRRLMYVDDGLVGP